MLSTTNNMIKIKKKITIESVYYPKEINVMMKVSKTDVILNITRKYYNDRSIILGESISYFVKDYISLICTN